MPSLPTYNAQRNITSQSADTFRNEASQPFEDQQKIIGTIQQINQEWSRANDIMQATEAKANYEKTALDVQARASQDNDYNNAPKYLKELETAKKDSLKKISNQQVANQVSAELDHSNTLTGFKIAGDFKQKQMKANIYNLEQDVLINANKKAMAQTDAERQTYQNNIDHSLMINQSLLTPQEIDTLRKQAELNAVGNLVYSDPQRAIEKIENDEFNLSPKEKGKLIHDANQLIARKQKEKSEFDKNLTYETEAQIAIDISQGKYPSIQTLANGVEKGLLTADFSTKVQKMITSPAVVAAKTSNVAFAQITDEIFKAKNKEDIQKAIVHILEGGGDGKLSQGDLGVLINSAMMQRVEIREDAKNAVIALGDWADQSKLDRAEVFRTFQKAISEGKSISEASNEAMKKTIVDNIPGASNLEDVPNAVVTKDSPIRFIFPKESNVYPSRIFNPTSGKLESNPEVKSDKRSR